MIDMGGLRGYCRMDRRKSAEIESFHSLLLVDGLGTY